MDHPGHFKFSPLRNVIIVYSHNPVTRFQGAFNTGRGVIKDLYNVHMRAQRGATPNANPDQVGLVLRQRHDPRSHVKQLCDVMWEMNLKSADTKGLSSMAQLFLVYTDE